MGSASNFLYTIIPEELNPVRIKEISTDLFQVGKVLVTISYHINVCPHPILSTYELQTGDFVLRLSYHEQIYVTGCLHLFAIRYDGCELKHKPSQERNLQAASEDDRFMDETPSAGLPRLSYAGVARTNNRTSRRRAPIPYFIASNI